MKHGRVGVWPRAACRTARALPLQALPFPLDRPSVRLHARARHALAISLPTLGLRTGDEVLVPTWHHGSEVQALLAAGLSVVPYELRPDLQPAEADLERLLTPRTRVLHLTHYLGFPQDGARWRRWCDDHGLLLVEDAAQAWLATTGGLPVGVHGDLAVFCLYKSVGLPDGAAAVSRTGAELPPPDRAGGRGLRWAAARGREAVLPVGAPSATLDEPYDQQADIAVNALSQAPSGLTSWLLPRSAPHSVAAARRRAAGVLLEELPHLAVPPFAVVPPGASPFVLPIAVRSRREALRCLAATGIVALDLWSTGHPAVDVRPDGVAAWLRRHVIGLPVHQDLDEAALHRIVVAARTLDTAPSSRPASDRHAVT